MTNRTKISCGSKSTRPDELLNVWDADNTLTTKYARKFDPTLMSCHSPTFMTNLKHLVKYRKRMVDFKYLTFFCFDWESGNLRGSSST